MQMFFLVQKYNVILSMSEPLDTMLLTQQFSIVLMFEKKLQSDFQARFNQCAHCQ